MSPLLISSIVFACVLAGTYAGFLLSQRLPGHHLSTESKDVVRLGIGMIATMAALILGLMTASAKSAFDAEDVAIKQVATNTLALDRALANYGAETKDVRTELRKAIEFRLNLTWPEDSKVEARLVASESTPTVEGIERQIVELTPQTEEQRWYKSKALALASALLQTRWAVFGSTESSIPVSFLVIVAFWLAVIFATFGMFAPRNSTVVVVMFVCVLSVAASVFLILEMDQPFGGWMKVSSAPLRFALENLGK